MRPRAHFVPREHLIIQITSLPVLPSHPIGVEAWDEAPGLPCFEKMSRAQKNQAKKCQTKN